MNTCIRFKIRTPCWCRQFLPAALAAHAESIGTEYQRIELTRIAEGLEHPWSIAFLPDGRMLVTERPGRLNIIDGDGNRIRVSGTPEVTALGQGGLMEAALP
jgi:aldose sugar dehydrogenase